MAKRISVCVGASETMRDGTPGAAVPGAGSEPCVAAGTSAGASVAAAGSAALIAGPWITRLDPTRHVYEATVWVLVIWTVAHVGAGVIMQAYCVARRAAGHMTPRHDADLVNVTLYWHFVAVTALITVAVIAGFPLVA